VSGINVPGVTTPITTGPMLDPTTGAPQASEGEGLIKGLVLAAAAVGVGLLAWKFVKGRGAAKEVVDVTNLVNEASTGGGQQALSKLFERIGSGSIKGKELTELLKNPQFQLLASGHGLGMATDIASTAASSQLGASLFAHANKLGPVDGFVMQATASAAAANISVDKAAQLMLANRQWGVVERAVVNGGGLADLALANITGLQLAGSASNAAAGATKLAGLQSMLTGMASALT
jgi:hypothetical protein